MDYNKKIKEMENRGKKMYIISKNMSKTNDQIFNALESPNENIKTILKKVEKLRIKKLNYENKYFELMKEDIILGKLEETCIRKIAKNEDQKCKLYYGLEAKHNVFH